MTSLIRLYRSDAVKRNESFFTRCVRDWSGILCERMSGTRSGDGCEIGIWERDLGTGARLVFGNGIWERVENKSERRYSGKPDA